MSTKTTDTNQISYDQPSTNVYNSLQPGIGSTLTNFMQNPLVASFFNQRVGLGNKQVSQQGAGLMQNMMSNYRGAGGTTMSPFLQSQILKQGRQTQAGMSNNLLSQLSTANNMQVGATGMAQAYNPLMTGSTGTQTTSGLGTWLPQLLAAAGGAVQGASSTSGSGGFQPTNVYSSNPAPTGPAGVMGTVPGMSGTGAFPSAPFMGLTPGVIPSGPSSLPSWFG